MYIYADNAATTKTSQAAIKAMNECMEDFYGNLFYIRWKRS